MMQEITLCGITFQTSTQWQYVPTEQYIVARRDTFVGLLRMAIADPLPAEATNSENLLQLASKFIGGGELSKPFDLKSMAQEKRHFGAASYKMPGKKRPFMARVWYLSVQDLTIFATYGCYWRHRNSEAVLQELSECDKMILSVRRAAELT